MIDERTLELIHGELDGAASTQEQAELRQLLDENIEAREYYHKMQTLFTAMRSVQTDAEPPAGLRDRISKALPAQAPIRFRHSALRNFGGVIANKIQFSFSPNIGVTTMKKQYVFAFAAVAIIALVSYAIIAPWPPKDDTQGTIGAAKKYRSEQVNDKDVVLEPQNNGTASTGDNSTTGSTNANQTAKLTAEQTAKLTAEQTAKLTAEQTAKLTAEQTAKLTAQQTAKLSAEQTAKLGAQQTAKLGAQRTTKVGAQQTAKLSAEQKAKIGVSKQAQAPAEKQATPGGGN